MSTFEPIDEKYDVIAQAHAEIQQELFREAVEKYKAKLRAKKSVWDRIFPWRIVFVRKQNVV